MLDRQHKKTKLIGNETIQFIPVVILRLVPLMLLCQSLSNEIQNLIRVWWEAVLTDRLAKSTVFLKYEVPVSLISQIPELVIIGSQRQIEYSLDGP